MFWTRSSNVLSKHSKAASDSRKPKCSWAKFVRRIYPRTDEVAPTGRTLRVPAAHPFSTVALELEPLHVNGNGGAVAGESDYTPPEGEGRCRTISPGSVLARL